MPDFRAALVDAVTLETAYTPPLRIPQPFAERGAPSLVTRFLRPRITFYLRDGSKLAELVPAGAPEPNRWPFVLVALVLAGAAAVAGLVWLVRRAL